MDTVSALLELGFERVERVPAGCRSTPVGPAGCRVSAVRPAMGTVVSVVAIDRSGSRAEDAIEAAFAKMDRLVAILSRHDAASPVSHLNETGRLRGTPPELTRVVERALRYHRLTGGAFDVTVKPLMDLFERSERPPAPAERAEVEELVGAEHVELSGDRLDFTRSGMAITLDGIAKGFIVDGMAETLARLGIRDFLVNAGGDIRAAGRREDGRPWRIAVRDPMDPEGFCDVVEIGDGAVATSGNYEKEYRHLLTCDGSGSPPWSTSVSVMAASAVEADALATALFVMDPEAGRRAARSLPGCDYLVLDARGAPASSPGWTRAATREPRNRGSTT